MLDFGDLIPASLSTIEVTDGLGALVDAPTLPVLTITRTATGTTQVSPTAFTVTHPTLGIYGLDQTTYRLPAAGQFELSWNVPGPNGGVHETVVTVADTYTPFISADDALAHLRARGTIVSDTDMEQLRWLCLVACRAIEADLGRAISRQTVIEEHDAVKSSLILRRTPVASVTSVVVDGTTASAADYQCGAGGILRSMSGWGGTWGIATVTYVAVMDPAPEVLRKVALNSVQRMWQTSQNAPHPAFGDSLGGGGDFAATAVLSQLGHLTPVEYGAYLSFKSTGIA